MKNRRNHSSKEAEYFFKIGFKAINDVNEFCGVMNRLEKFVISAEVRSGTFAVDARSLMGIFSLNLKSPLRCGLRQKSPSRRKLWIWISILRLRSRSG